MKVIKRDGTIQEYDFLKITNAVASAFAEVGHEVPDKFLEQLREAVERVIIKNNGNGTPIEEIQDTIQKELIKRNKYEVVDAFIRYRRYHDEIREQKSDLMKRVERAMSGKQIANQNANLDEESFGGRVGEATSVVCKNLALKHMRARSRKNHENNEVYIHDLDAWEDGRHNCLSLPLDDLLAKGVKTRQVYIRPAGSLNTAMQLVAVYFQLQSLNQFGGVSATHLDWTMVPYVRKSFAKHYSIGLKYIDSIDSNWKKNAERPIDDDEYLSNMKVYRYAWNMLEKETHQAVEGMYHNLNSLQSRSGNQLPFTSINYGTCTLPEGRMVIQKLLELSIEGLGVAGETSIFPCGIFQWDKEWNAYPGTPNYDLYRLALKSTAMRIYPNYANVNWSGNAGYDRNDPKTYFSTMGCRTSNGLDINAEPGTNPQTKDGRGNICPVTVIMPTLAMRALQKAEKNGTSPHDEFIKLLDKKLEEARDTLVERFNHIASQSPASGKFMYENGTMLGYHPEEGIISALKHGTLALGQLGLAETLQILYSTDHTTEEGMKYAKEIEQLFKTRCAEWKQAYKLNFGVYYTPAENLCYTAMNKFKQMFPGYEKENVTYLIDDNGNKCDKLYFTNSMHVPVWAKMDPFKKIDIESQLTGYSNAGCITYVEIDSGGANNIDAMEKIVNYAMEHDVPYFALNIKIMQCKKCRERIWNKNIECCPKCGNTEYEELGRVTGYLSTTVEHFNKGKQHEYEDRVRHTSSVVKSWV